MNPDAESLIEQAKNLDNPTPEDRARVKRALRISLASAGTLGTVGTAATAAAGQVAEGSGVTKVGILGAFAVPKVAVWSAGVIFAGAVGWGTLEVVGESREASVVSRSFHDEKPTTSDTAPEIPPPHHRAWKPSGALDERRQVPAPGPSTTGLGQVPDGADPNDTAPTLIPRAQAVSSKSPPQSPEYSGGSDSGRKSQLPGGRANSSETSSTPPKSTLEVELTLIRGAQGALRKGKPSNALELVRLHETRFPGGVLTEERLAAKALALCQMGQMDAARTTIEQFQRTSANSPLWDRVTNECRLSRR